jgi:hypothetical protein
MDSKHNVNIIHAEDVSVHVQDLEHELLWYKQSELRTLYFKIPFLFAGSTTSGYDGSLLTRLQTMPAWKECRALRICCDNDAV